MESMPSVRNKPHLIHFPKGELYLSKRFKDFPDGGSSQESTCKAGDTGDTGWIPEMGQSPGGGNGNPLQYSCLEYPMDRGAWQATEQRVIKSWTQLK